MKVSEILRRAARENLWDGRSHIHARREFSFHAVIWAVEGWPKDALEFLRSLGVGRDGNQFNEFRYGERRQGARFLWLEFAALVAEDEGI